MLGNETLASGLGQGLGIGLQLLAEVGGTLFVIAGLDVGFQLWNYHRQLRMTREELREESGRVTTMMALYAADNARSEADSIARSPEVQRSFATGV